MSRRFGKRSESFPRLRRRPQISAWSMCPDPWDETPYKGWLQRPAEERDLLDTAQLVFVQQSVDRYHEHLRNEPVRHCIDHRAPRVAWSEQKSSSARGRFHLPHDPWNRSRYWEQAAIQGNPAHFHRAAPKEFPVVLIAPGWGEYVCRPGESVRPGCLRPRIYRRAICVHSWCALPCREWWTLSAVRSPPSCGSRNPYWVPDVQPFATRRMTNEQIGRDLRRTHRREIRYHHSSEANPLLLGDPRIRNPRLRPVIGSVQDVVALERERRFDGTRGMCCSCAAR